MKVLVVTHTLSRKAGGLFYSVRELSRELSTHKNVKLEVVGMTDAFFDEDFAQWQGVNVCSFNNTMRFLKFGWSFSMLRYIIKSDCDLIHLHGIWNFASFAVFIRSVIRPIPYIVSPRGMLDKWILNKNKFLKKVYWTFLERKLLKNASFVHALNESEKSSALELLPKTNVVVSPNGVECCKISVKSAKDSIKKMVFIGRLDPKKGVVELIQSWNVLKNKNNWALDIYGWGDEEYIKKIKSGISLNKDDSITLYGPIHGKAKSVVLENASAFVLPSFSEGLPMAILEAWAHGLPVAMTEQCNLPIGFEKNAAKKISIASLESDLSQFLSLPNSELSACSKNAIELIEEKFLWKNIAIQMMNYYRKCIC